MDWAQLQYVGSILVVVDTSGQLEAAVCLDQKPTTVINLRAILARFGVPLLMVTGGEPEFASGDLQTWLKGTGCRLALAVLSSVPSRTTARSAWSVVKDALKCFKPNKASVLPYPHRVLLVHEHCTAKW